MTTNTPAAAMPALQYIEHSPDVVFTDLGDEGVIMHSLSGEAFRLNASGVLLWRACPADTTTLARTLVDQWRITAEQAHADVNAWIDTLLRHELILIQPAHTTPAP